jgi:iron(III) transport system substrate-binding protein
MRRIVAALVLLTTVLCLAGSITVSANSNWADVVEAAKREGKLVVYTSVGRVAQSAETFTKKYGINVEVYNLRDYEIVQRISQEYRSKIYNVDMTVIENIPAVVTQLVRPGYVYNFVPPTMEGLVPKQYQDPMVMGLVSRVVGFNNEVYPADPFDSIWDLTLPEWKGKVLLRDPALTGDHINFFTEMMRRSKDLEADYKRRFGKPLEMREENAAFEFIRRLVENDVVIMTSDTRIANGIGQKGQEDPPVGLFYVYSKHRDIPINDLALQESRNLKPFVGYYYKVFMQMASKAKNPNAAKLFAEFLLSEEGFKPFQDSPGFYSPNPTIPVVWEGDMPWSYWEDKLWTYDTDYAIRNRGAVLEFWQGIAR